MHSWIRPHDPSGVNNGINDGGIYTFKERKFESLAREILQNSMDEQLAEDKPVRVEFSLFEIPVAMIPASDQYIALFKDSLHYWKNHHQDNAKNFFEQALSVLSKASVPVLRISDFNTKGVKGSHVTTIRSSGDITPWYNLIKSEGSSSKGATQGGSFGIGKNATFAASSLRTVLYTTYDEDGVKAQEGQAKLASIFKDGRPYSSKAFYGEVLGEQTRAIHEILSLDEHFQRKSYGTDIYLLGFEAEEDWILRMGISILSDFFLPIQDQQLEVILQGQQIRHDTLADIFQEYETQAVDMRLSAQLRHELQNAKNYFEVATSDKTLTFEKTYENLGKAILRVLYQPDFDRKVMRTRKTGMKLFAQGNISSSIGFSGILSLEGDNLNRLFRKMENPAHTAWSPDNVDLPQDKKTAKATLSNLNKWIKDTINENAYDKTLETQEVGGLGEYLPSFGDFTENQGASPKEVISDQILDFKVYTSSREELKKRKQEILEQVTGSYAGEDGEDGGAYTGLKNKSLQKGGEGGIKEGSVSSAGENPVLKTVSANCYSTRLIQSQKDLVLLLGAQKHLKKAELLLSISGETTKESVAVVKAYHKKTGETYPIENDRIQLGSLLEGMKIPLVIELKNRESFALEVKMYEHQA